jgi:drug/metabolite transporter (DMT)-like permease
VVVGALGVTVPFTLFGYGEQHISSILGGIWNATTPLVVLPMAVWVFRTERITGRSAGGLLLGFVGVLVVLGVWQGVGGATLTGQLQCFVAAACYGFVIPYQKRFVMGSDASGLSLAVTQLLVATVALAVVAPLVAGAPPPLSGLSPEVVASVLALGVLGTGFAFVMNMRNIRLAGASTAATVTYLIPIFAVVVGVIVLNVRLEWYQPVGALIVLAGVAVARARRRTRPVELAG